ARAVVSYPGGWADYIRAQEAPAAQPEPAPKAKRERPKRPPRPEPSALDVVEAEVEQAEARLAEVERRLAADWSDAELVAEHARARAQLEALLSRWEALFSGSGSTAR
ncbi:MAG TPA: ABC transporter C-terminal domain-containing protein, partial [Gaiellaceae bacterium]